MNWPIVIVNVSRLQRYNLFWINFKTTRNPQIFQKILESDNIHKIIPVKSLSSLNIDVKELQKYLLNFNEKISKKVHLIEEGDIEKSLDRLFESKVPSIKAHASMVVRVL